MSDSEKWGVSTKLVHAGEWRPRVLGAVSMPIFQTANWVEDGDASDYHSVHYMRLSNLPNHTVLAEKMAALEGAEAALVTASGMAAISAALLSVLKAGDHILVQDELYGGTHSFVANDLPRWGIEVDFIDGENPSSWEGKLRPNTRAIYFESITNPRLRVANLDAVVPFAQAHDLVSMIDNTMATPLYFKPAEWGFDLSLHSATKYLNGHSDIVGGVVIGKADLVTQVHHKLDHLGGSMDTHTCSLLHRGVRTLALRLPAQTKTAQALAQMFQDHPRVTRVYYPGLESSAGHDNAKRLLAGYSAMVSIDIDGGKEAAKRFVERSQLITDAPSFGGLETLATRPAASSHAGLTPAERAERGIADGLVRLSVGIEDTADLLADFTQALD